MLIIFLDVGSTLLVLNCNKVKYYEKTVPTCRISLKYATVTRNLLFYAQKGFQDNRINFKIFQPSLQCSDENKINYSSSSTECPSNHLFKVDN